MATKTAQELRAEVPELLRAASTKVASLAETVASQASHIETMETQLEAIKIARVLEERDLYPDQSFEGKVAQIVALPAEKRAALSMSLSMRPDDFGLGKVASAEDPDGSATAGKHDIDNFITSGAALS